METLQDSKQEKFNAATEEVKKLLAQGNIHESLLLHACAALIVAFKDSREEIKVLNRIISRYEFPIDSIIIGSKSGNIETHKLLRCLKQSPQLTQVIELINIVTKDGKKRNASNAARARHRNTSAKREEIIKYWHEHIYPTHPKLSNEKTGAWLHDTFPDLSVRKLSEYVSEAKKEMKKLPSASKA